MVSPGGGGGGGGYSVWKRLPTAVQPLLSVAVGGGGGVCSIGCAGYLLVVDQPTHEIKHT